MSFKGFSNTAVTVGNPPTQYWNFVTSSWQAMTGLDPRGLQHPFLPNTWKNTRGQWVFVPDQHTGNLDCKLRMDYFASLATQNDLYHLERAYNAYFGPSPTEAIPECAGIYGSYTGSTGGGGGGGGGVIPTNGGSSGGSGNGSAGSGSGGTPIGPSTGFEFSFSNPMVIIALIGVGVILLMKFKN